MVVRRRTVDLLPEIFRTETNQQFFAATLDQLTQEPSVVKTQGYVGRRVGPGVNPADNYVVEPTAQRTDYQLEPGVVFYKPDTTTPEDAITYPGMIDALALQGANTQRQDRLFQSQYYVWDPFCDLDKFTNYSQYYWLPLGPDPVDVNATDVPLTDSFLVTRTNNGYQLTGQAGDNPTLTLVRGGNYTFQVNQGTARFWIQTEPGVNGRLVGAPNISSRDVLGVINNGASGGVISFNVPLKTAQDFFYTLNDIGVIPGRAPSTFGTVDLMTDLKFNEINNVYVSEFLRLHPAGIDGITNLDGRALVFTNRIEDSQDGGWQVTTQFDPLPRPGAPRTSDNTGTIISGPVSPFDGQIGSFDTTLFDQTTDLVNVNLRYGVWQIRYVLDNDGQPFMRLDPVLNIANLEKWRVLFGDQWSNTQWYRNASGFPEKIPLLTANLEELWYQDSENPELFGRIRLVDTSGLNPVVIDEIIGAQNYTSPNGVVFTNGLKVQFRGLTEPRQFQNLEYYVDGVGTGPGIDSRVGFVDGEAYFGPWHLFNNQKLTGAVHSETVFQQYIYDTLAESLANPGAGYPEGAPLPTQGVLGATQGNGIRLVPVRELVTPETYTQSLSEPYDSVPYDFGGYDGTLNAPITPDYITINRASRDRNAWSRSNRWFHIDVIKYAAELNNQIPVLDNRARGKRPIIEFRPDIKLFNFGTQGKIPVNIIDFAATDALSNINGQIGYNTDGYAFIDGSRVVFAADRDPEVRNRIYEVTFIDPDGDPGSAPIINLTPVIDGQALIDQTLVALSGNTQQGKSYWFDGSDWILAQQKISVNQAPLFDVYDDQGRSFSDLAVYPSSTFAGSRLFGYAVGGSPTSDEVLGFALRFLNINNIGDIVFENYLYTDTFLYVRDSVSFEQPISQGFVRQYIDRTLFSREIGWQDAIVENRSRQVFRFVYDGTPLILDVPVVSDSRCAPIQIFQGTVYIEPGQYSTVITETNTIITLTTPPPEGTVLEVQVISDVASAVAFYQVPLNLENNALNENSDVFTLGTIRTYYESIGQNLCDIQGPIIGANNTRDLGNILRYGDLIIQNSAPLALAGPFLRERQYEIVDAIQFNSQEYEKFKALLLDLAGKGDFVNRTPTQILDIVLEEIALGKNNVSPFYWSDMLPAGSNYTSTIYPVTLITGDTFDTLQTYDYTASNFLGLNVYLNGQIQLRGYDYQVNPDSRTITFLKDLAVGDQIELREFPQTYGTYVPNTPTKMGLYAKYRPEMYLDTSYVTPTMVIRGHDGSITVAFGDKRDEVLLEYETRVFNNIKIVTAVPIDATEVIPGQFRSTNYSLAEINEILSTDFLTWVAWNKLDYSTQVYLPDDSFTFNYSQSANKLNGAPLLGAWRGIYNFFYDTTTPNTTPWQMLGFSERPEWWEAYYGPAPYTSGNLVLWEDLAAGLVRDPAGSYIVPRYARPGLISAIPSGTEGELLPPLDSVVGNYDGTSFRRSWVFGDDGQVENVWRTSSAWPFAVMRLLALTKPAKFFSLFADRDRYVFQQDLAQWLWDGRYRLDAKQITPIYGDGVSKASYINWIIDYNRQLGANSTNRLTESLANIGVQLCWRLAGFSDKRYLSVFTERSTPSGTNAGLLLPDESYNLLLYKNQPFGEVAYSSVIVQLTDTGYQIFGYSNTRPYFEVLVSRPNGPTILIQTGEGSGNTAVSIARDHTDNVTQIPYGYTFTNRAAVCDFLYSYGLLLERQGFVFESQENGYVLNWLQMCQEFLYWSNQGWGPGSIINLNPGATRVSVTRPGSVVDSLADPRPKNLILNQNRLPISPNNLVLERLANTFRATSLTQDTINYLNVSFTSYEHMVVFDNRTIFNDLIYSPVTGARQSRVLVSGILSGDWDGTVNAPGFVLNQDNIPEWKQNQVYAKGEIVLFKNEYWAASTIIQPSQDFNYNLWIKTEYDLIQKGLLPNAANASDELAQSYSVYNASLQEETDLFSYGLIGFRPRDYMAALNLDDVSQVQLYQQFLGTKGTRRAAEIFSLADLGKEIAQYDIYEYWALLRAGYGATANRNYIEILLNESKLRADPSLVQVVLPQQSSQADQTVLLENLYKTSDVLTSTNILPTVLAPVSDTALPTAGYVNIDDVDFTVFDLEDFSSVRDDLNANVDEIGVGSTLWAAKVNSYDWSVYRVETVPGDIVLISDNLDGRSVVEFTEPHGLTENSVLIIRFFDPAVNGTYRVVSVPSLYQVIIDYTFIGRQTEFVGIGVGFTLQTARVAQASDVADLPYAQSLLPGDRAWVDNDGNGRWTVLQKQQPFTEQDDLPLQQPLAGSRVGTAVAQSQNNLAALIGAPGYGAGGAVYSYIKDDSDRYAENILIELLSTGTAGFGSAIDMASQEWSVIGASESASSQGYALIINNPISSNAFTKYQLLLDTTGSAGDEFGYSVTISQDQRWIYVGAPGANKVYGYGLVQVATQTVKYTANGTNTNFSYQDSVVIDDASELVVVLNNVPQTSGYSVDTGSQTVVFGTAPTAGSTVLLTRRLSALITATGAVSYSLDNIYGINGLDSFAVYINDTIQRPGLDYTLSGTTITFVSAPSVGAGIRVRAGSYYRRCFVIDDSLIPGGLSSGDRLGHAVATTTNGRQILVGAPGVDNSEGRVYVFDRSVQRFQVQTAGQTTFLPVQPLTLSPVNVLQNGIYLVDTSGNVDGQFTVIDDSSDSVVLTNGAAVGDIVEVETNQVTLVQSLQAAAAGIGYQFGSVVDQCLSNCSLYIGSPFDSSRDLVEEGSVDYRINQARVYGNITGTLQNPNLSSNVGQYIRVNDYFVQLSSVPTWSSLTGYSTGDFVSQSGTIYLALRSVPAGTALTEQDYWATSSWVAVLAQDIVDAAIPNVTATVSNNRILIFVKNQNTTTANDRLQVLPGTGSLFTAVGLEPLALVQTFFSPNAQAYAHFGSAININETSRNLVIGAPDATAIEPTTFDLSTTIWDALSTQFADPVPQSGAVFAFDLLPAVNPSVTNPSRFVFGQQILPDDLSPLDRFGASVNYTTGTLLVGSPNEDADDSTSDSGRVSQFINVNRSPAWTVTRLQQPVVDTQLINTVFMYDRFGTGSKQYFDSIDPLQGKLLGAVRQNINYIGAIDPAAYNNGKINNYGQIWTQNRVGEIWWDTSSVRFIDPNQDDIVYASRRWAQLFPGSKVEVYQWISSSVPPDQYQGPGTVRSVDSYVLTTAVNEQGIIETVYYFWAQGIRTVNRAIGKTLSIETLARYIESPKSSGIPYVAGINSSTVAIYNGLPYISAEDTVLHVEYDETPNDDAVHYEYSLIAQDRADGVLNAREYQKWLDSLSGYDTVGNPVPNPFLQESERYGVAFRPRQSMFVNRFLALQNYLTEANSVMRALPIAETRSFPLLESSEPEPTQSSGAWDLRVANLSELSYQDLAIVPFGYRYLVESDSSNNGLWTIYEVQPGGLPGSKVLGLVRVQNFDTRLYWQYINWYQAGFDPATVIATEVANVGLLVTLSLPNGSVVKVTSNGQGRWELYRLTDGEWIRVGLQSGTIQIKEEIWNYSLARFGFDVEVFDAQYFDQEPVIETRRILQALNQEILIDDLALERNRLLILTFNYILGEQIAPLWLTKTSLIDVDHVIRNLLPFQIYRQDNQDFVLNYIQEVKPYHTQIREFNLIYQGSDEYQGTVTDFDVPAYYNETQALFVSPVLDNVGNLSTTSSTPSTSVIWQTFPWNQWYQNYLLSIQTVTVVNGGSGYTVAPEVVVTGECERQAVMFARINSAGRVSEIIVLDPGQGYLTTALITFEGGNGTGAQAVANMGNSLIREFKTTIKYDRYQYQTSVLTWQPNTVYTQGQLVRYADVVWSADNTFSSASFDPEDWTRVPAGDLTGVDRTMGYYVPTVNEVGLDLALLITGVDYPGVQVDAPDYNENTGFDVGNYDINPFDNISFSPEGRPTYDPAILDAIYESQFTDTFLGVLPAPAYGGDPQDTREYGIEVDGGAFVDTYSSHAPEELVPGAIFDTLDFRVFTTPGADWSGNGHGFPVSSVNYEYTGSGALSFNGVLDFPVTLRVFNQTTGTLLDPAQYTVNWINSTVNIGAGVAAGEIVSINVYGLGGGNQIFQNSYQGATAGDSITVPIQESIIENIVIFVNGSPVTNYSWAADGDFATTITFTSSLSSTDLATVTVLGQPLNSNSWSAPVTQYLIADGGLSYVMTNSLAGTNPANILVTIQGRRSRPAEGVAYTGDGSTTTFELPQRGGYSQALIANNEVFVYVDNQPLVLGVGYVVDAFDISSDRTVTLATAPAAGAQVLISVTTEADYNIVGNLISWKPSAPLIPLLGETIAITTWNDTSEQDILTEVFVGPESRGVISAEGYDTTVYDAGSLSGAPGSYDYSTGALVQTNRFETGRVITDSSRLVVSLNGVFLFDGVDFETDGSVVEILGPVIDTTAVVAVTLFTQSVVPGPIAFRIFQDMRGQQLTYRITEDTTTELAQSLSSTADTIYVTDASRLSAPNLEQGIFGQITIGGERITYRVRNTTTNTLSGLRRGVAGTGAATHAVDTPVYDIGLGNLLPLQYQDRVLTTQLSTAVPNPYLGDGSTTTFVATDISVAGLDSTEIIEAVRVYVGGELQTQGYSVTQANPVTVEFDQAPADGTLVTIQVLRGQSWYQPGGGNPSNGQPLQKTDTVAARFFREE